MPLFTVERQFLVPHYEQLTVWAVDAEAACRAALDENKHPWDKPKPDFESSRRTTVTGVWAGGIAYEGDALPVPEVPHPTS